MKEREIAWGPLVGAAMVGLILTFMSRALVPVVWERAQSLFYVRVPGQMLECTVTLEGTRALPVIKLGYRYRHESIERVGEHWRARPLFFHEGNYQQVCQRLLAQHDVDVWLDPRHPERATLERGFAGHDLVAMLAAFGLLMLAAGFAWGGIIGGASPGRRLEPSVEIVGDETQIHNTLYPGTLAGLLLMVGALGLATVLGVVFGNGVSRDAVGGGLGVLLALVALTYFVERRGHRRGTSAIVIDHVRRIVLLRKEPARRRVTIGVDDLRTLAIFAFPYHSEEGSGFTFSVGAHASPKTSEVIWVQRFMGLEQARGLVRVLARTIDALRPDQPIVASYEPEPGPSRHLPDHRS